MLEMFNGRFFSMNMKFIMDIKLFFLICFICINMIQLSYQLLYILLSVDWKYRLNGFLFYELSLFINICFDIYVKDSYMII